MKKTCKFSILMIVFALAVMILLSSLSFSPITANAASYTGDYFCISQEPISNGRLVWEFKIGLNSEAKGFANENEKGTYRVKIQVILQEIFDKKKAEYQSIYDANPLEKYNPVNCVSYANVIYDQQSDSASFRFYFKDSDTYNFYNSKPTDVNEVVDNLFITKQVKETIFPFAELVETENETINLAQYYRNLVISACEGLSIEQSMMTYDPQFIYDYANYSNKIKSNADLTYKDVVGKYHYAWGAKVSNVNSNIVMNRSLTTPKRGWWYLFAIALPLVGMGIAITVVVIKDKKGKKEEKKTA